MGIKYAQLAQARESTPKGVRDTMWGRFYPGQSASGYGRKISTEYQVRLAGENRWRRVFCTCFSNVGSNWVVQNGQALYIHDHELRQLLGR